MNLLVPRNLIAMVAVGCAALIVSFWVGASTVVIAKTVASTAFVALGIKVGGTRSTYGRLILLGLVFSWFGDVFLIVVSERAFLAGLAAFLIAHVAYIAAFVVRGINLRWAALASLPIATTAFVVSLWLAPHVAPYLAGPVRLYIVVIGLMVIAAFGTNGRYASVLIVAGALMFFLSDLSVAALRLAQTDYPTYVLGLPLYYAAQVCFAMSVSQSRSH